MERRREGMKEGRKGKKQRMKRERDRGEMGTELGGEKRRCGRGEDAQARRQEEKLCPKHQSVIIYNTTLWWIEDSYVSV